MRRHLLRHLIVGALALAPASANAEPALSCNQAIRRLMSLVDQPTAVALASAPKVRDRGDLGYRLSWPISSGTEMAINCTKASAVNAISIYADPAPDGGASASFRSLSAKAMCSVARGDCDSMFDLTLLRSRTTAKPKVYADLGNGLSIDFSNWPDGQEFSIGVDFGSSIAEAQKPFTLVWVDNDGKAIP